MEKGVREKETVKAQNPVVGDGILRFGRTVHFCASRINRLG